MKQSYHGGSSSRTSSTPATAASLRPRTARLISGLDEGDEVNFNPSSTAPTTRVASPVTQSASPFDSRGPSPLPARHLSRPVTSTSSLRRPRDNNVTASSSSPSLRELGVPSSASLRAVTTRDQSPSLSLFFTDSWNALQNKATEMLSGGSGTSSPVRGQPQTHHKRRKPSQGGGPPGQRHQRPDRP